MKRSEVEKITGLTRKALLYYEEKGLVEPHRGEHDYREYTQEDLVRLQQMGKLRMMGLSFNDIRKLWTDPESIGSILHRLEQNLTWEKEKLKVLKRFLGGESTEEELAAMERRENLYQRLTKAFSGYFGDLLLYMKEIEKEVKHQSKR